MKSGRFRAEEFSASDSGCDVHIGPYRFVGDPHEYDLRFAGPASLDRFEAGELVEQHEGTGSFEQCYFGHKLHGDT